MYSEPGVSRQDLVAKWLPLVEHVVSRSFFWTASGGLSERLTQRSVDRDDMVQEGTVGLLTAMAEFREDAGATFKTYCYAVIYRHIELYLQRNYTMLSHPNSHNIRRFAKPATVAKLEQAFRYRLFSDLGLPRNRSGRESQPNRAFDVEDAFSNHEDEYDQKDLNAVTLRAIQESLSDEDYQVLIDKFSGSTYLTIAARLGTTRHKAAHRVQSILSECRKVANALR